MLLDWQNQHSSTNVHVTQSNLQIQWDPSQNPNSILLRIRKDDAKMYLETQETTNSQNYPEEQYKTGGIIISDLKTYHEHSLVMAQNQRRRSME